MASPLSATGVRPAHRHRPEPQDQNFCVKRTYGWTPYESYR